LKQTYESQPDFERAGLAYAIALVVAGREGEIHEIPSANIKLTDVLGTLRTVKSTNGYYKAFAIFSGIVLTSNDTNVLLQQAEMEYSLGLNMMAIGTLQKIGNIDPSLKDSTDAAIKVMRK
jgi:hypothetical protein